MIGEGTRVRFVPAFKTKCHEFNVESDMVNGKIVSVNWEHKTFFVEYYSGGTRQIEAFKFFDIGKSVKILGR